MSRNAPTALARFGLGARPGDMARLGNDPAEALLAELKPAAAELTGADLPSTAEALAALRALRVEKKAERAEQPAKGDDQPAAAQMAAPQRIYLAEFAARLDRASDADIGYVERLVAFWANHFTVAANASQVVRILAGAFEREAIRPHVLGNFHDMLVAATRHAAMLAYLNNAESVGPNSRAGLKRSRGLNENHARELMELHTVGVDGGYTQADVTAFAKVLSGWSTSRGDADNGAAGDFIFRAAAHEPGSQTVMGKVYSERGEQQGLAVIADLAASPKTARHIATKLARSFVSDNPPPALIDRLAGDFISTGGDLLSLSRRLVASDEAWEGAGKFRTPQQFVFSSIRALGLKPRPGLAIRTLRSLGQLPWNSPSPAGYDAADATWLAPDALTNRVDTAELMAAQAPSHLDAGTLAGEVLARPASPKTIEAIGRAESREQALALLLMSPEFQRT